MDTTLVVVLAAAWIVVGLLFGLWMARHGHDPLWTLIAVVLGPLFVPIAMERVQRRPSVATFGRKGAPPLRSDAAPGLRVLVGYDGSAEAERGLATALRLFGPHCGLLVLAEVVHYETAENANRTDLEAASERLAGLVDGAEIVGVVHTE
ncbi:MAG: universal stress protein, partial [Dietzia sp.]|nr:universal stress protein [Dietzia sp.]